MSIVNAPLGRSVYWKDFKQFVESKHLDKNLVDALINQADVFRVTGLHRETLDILINDILSKYTLDDEYHDEFQRAITEWNSLTDHNREIWEKGFEADITFTPNAFSKIPNSRANHRPISELSEKPFTMCKEIDRAVTPEGLESTSNFLTNMRREKNQLEYCNEADVEPYVRGIIKDILKCLGLEDEYYFQYQASIVSQPDLDEKANLKSDIWTVKKRYG